jgi:hypothetical protein
MWSMSSRSKFEPEQDRVIDVVDVVRDRRLAAEAGVAGAEAADEGRHAGPEGALHAAELRVGHDRAQVGNAVQPALLELVRGDRGDRDRGVLQVGRLAGRGNEDIADSTVVLVLGLDRARS